MRWHELLSRAGQVITAAGDWGGRMEARLERLREEAGVAAWIPAEKQLDVTDDMRDHIIEARGSMPSAQWLREGGPRDTVCERFGLTPEQVAGVLAGQTGRTNGTHSASSDEQPPNLANRPSGSTLKPVDKITHDPETWPDRNPKRSGADKTKPPRRGHKEYEIDVVDRMIVIAVLKHEGSDWNTVRHTIALKRRLLGQQLGKLKQLHTQGKLSVAA